MNSTDDATEKDWMEDRIEAYLDGDLPEAERARFEALMALEPWQREVALAIRVRDTLRSSPQPACPPHVVRSVVWQARWARFMEYLGDFRLPALRPALVAAVLIVAAFAALWINRTPPADVSQAEIEQALSDVKWTLGYVSKTGRLTGASLHDALTPLRKEPDDR